VRMKQVSVERCREQAETHRRMAERADDLEGKAKLLQVAQTYEELAQMIVIKTKH
jgi:hypothetical protein